MKRFAVFGLLVMSGCVPPIVTNPVQLTPANAIALQDGTPIGRLSGYPGDPRAMVTFIFANGDTLVGDAILNPDIKNTMAIWGQTPQILSSVSSVEMSAVDDRQTMSCSGYLGPLTTNMTCNLSDGAIYRDDYTVPPPPPKPKAKAPVSLSIAKAPPMASSRLPHPK